MRFLNFYLLLFAVSCIQNKIDKMAGIPTNRKVTCYSAGKLIYSGTTRSRVNYERSYTMFNDGKGEVRIIRGDCVVSVPDEQEISQSLD